MAFTKVAPAGIGSTPGDGYRIGDSFLHSSGVEITNINATGILTAASLDISGAIDFDGHTELDNVNISGVSTFAGNIDANGDLDVDGHTNLDNLSVAGVTTFNANVKFDGANDGRDITFERGENALRFADQAIAKFGNSEDLKIFHDGSNSYIREIGSGGLYINTNLFRVTSSNATTPQYQNLIAADESGAVELYFNGTKRFETLSLIHI